jgi:predicted permease
VQLVKRDFRAREESTDPEKGAGRLKSKVMVLVGAGCRPSESSPANNAIENDSQSLKQPLSEPTVRHRSGDNGEIAEEDMDSQLQTVAGSMASRTPSFEEDAPEKRRLMKLVWKSYLAPIFTPPSLAMIVGLIVANIPPLKSLFVQTTRFDMPTAPDEKPPLDFVMDICDFGGSAVPVLGMILLGAALSRMSIKGLPEGFWKSAASMAFLKLIISMAPRSREGKSFVNSRRPDPRSRLDKDGNEPDRPDES